MKIGISTLKFNLEDALNICKKNKKNSKKSVDTYIGVLI